MPEPFRMELTLPNSPDALRLARACMDELIDLAGLTPEQGEGLERAAEEACANVIDHAFEPGESGTFTLAGEITPAEIIVSVRDQGIPLDADSEFDRLAERLSRDESPSRLSASGGLKLIREAVDQADWINHGPGGKELRLVKFRPDHHVTEDSTDDDLAPMAEDEPLAPEQEYLIRRFDPADAVGISRCVYRTYGYTYMHVDCYYPERIVRHNEAGTFASVVAVTQDGEVVGHYALERPGLTKVAERGIAIVSPAHRGRDLMQRMRTYVEEEAKRLGLIGVYSMAVTSHVYSQRVNEEFGSDVCGVALGGGGRQTSFKKIAEELPQRVSWVLYFTYVIDPLLAVVYAPARHREVLRQIYERLNAPFEFRESDGPAKGNGEISVNYTPSQDSGTIRVLQVGADTPIEIRRAKHDLCDVTGAEVVYLEVPLSQPGAAELCEAAEREGFFFSGLGPSFAADGDALLLQYLNVDLDTSKVKLASPFAGELLAYIDGERQRVGQLSAVSASS